ncbi:hypothetical protein C4E04_08785 [Microvirga sp. 17 mud 1-3]|nr:hypothetical protein C4E04_08785 [Microvirga sp. 17 mud 1-3]
MANVKGLGGAYLAIGGLFGWLIFMSNFWPVVRGVWYGCPLLELLYTSFIAVIVGFPGAILRALLWGPSLIMWFMGQHDHTSFWQWLVPGAFSTGVCGM